MLCAGVAFPTVFAGAGVPTTVETGRVLPPIGMAGAARGIAAIPGLTVAGNVLANEARPA